MILCSSRWRASSPQIHHPEHQDRQSCKPWQHCSKRHDDERASETDDQDRCDKDHSDTYGGTAQGTRYDTERHDQDDED